MAERSGAPADPTPAAAAPRRRGEGLSVLIAEDNKVNQNIVGRMLERLGCRVEVVDNGADAVAAVRRSAYQVVFMDIEMPELDGLAATAAIRSLPCPDQRRVWIVALTAAADEDDARRCRAAGMDDFVAKPVRLADLDACLGRVSLMARG
jgi:CheY-like chemotaxis protein